MLRGRVRIVGLGFKIWKSEFAVPVFAEKGGFCWRQQSSVKCLGMVSGWELDRQGYTEASKVRRSDRNLCKYATFFDPDIFQVAYHNLRYKRKIKATRVDEPLTQSMIFGLIEQMRNRSFQFRRLEIESIDGKFSGTPPLIDQLIQEVLRIILEPVFPKSQMTAQATLQQIRNWTDTTWLITTNTPGLFNNLDHSVLGDIIMRAVKDQQILDLYWKLVNAGLVKTGNQERHNLTGVSKGGLLWPLFTNVYLSEFDAWLKDFADSIPNPNNGALPRRKGSDTKVHYIRYCDQWVVGVNGPKSLAVETRDKIMLYLNEKLKLKTEEDSITISHLASEKVKFLGVLIGRRDRKYVESLVGQRAERAFGRIFLEAPVNEIVDKLVDRGFAVNEEFPRGMSAWIHLEAEEIMRRYKNIMRGLMKYYSIVDNKNMMRRVFWILRFSGIFTLCRKWRISTRALFKKLANEPQYEDFLKGRITSR